jgi:acetyltransferase
MRRDDERREDELLRGQLGALDADIDTAREDLRRLTTAHFEDFFHSPEAHSDPAGAEGERVTLRDGSVVVIRPVRPADASLVQEAFGKLSAVERYRRFLFDRRHLTSADAREATIVDRDHVAFGAIDPRSGRGIGLARCVRNEHDATCATAAVIVVDEWQGRGLATQLLGRLADEARGSGIDRFEAHMIVGDSSSERMFERVGAVEASKRAAGVVDLTVRLGG